MIVRPWAEFTTSLPDDGIEDETGFIQWPGKNVAEALAEILARLGCTEVEIFDLEHAGYDVGFRLGKLALAARVTVIDNPLIAFGPKRQPEYLDFLKRVSDALAQDGRFHNVRWFTDDEVLTGVEGAISPLEEPLNQAPPLDRTPTQASAAVRPWVRFTTDLVDEGVRAGDGRGYDQQPGIGVTPAISKMLARCGCKNITGSHNRYIGWDLNFLAGKRRLTARINRTHGAWFVFLWQESWIAKTFGLKRPEYVEVLRRLNAELAKDSRFHDVGWFFDREADPAIEGAPSPVDA
jgi:hypothetical protein